jgi:hypothetical protein
MVRIFISYNRVSLEVVQTVADDLQTAGHEVWFDRSISGGQQWWNEILRRIRECDVLMFALSPEATQSQACGAELRYAQQLSKGILPLLVADGVRTDLLPRPLGEIQYLDYRSPDRRTCFALSRALNCFGPAPPLPEPLPTAPPVPVSYLHDLQEKIDSAAGLGFEEQAALVLELKGKLSQPESREAVFELLRRMRRRDDLLARIAGEIDFLLTQVRGEEPKPAVAEEPEAPLIVDHDADEIARALLRVVQRGEVWRLGADPQNHIGGTPGLRRPHRGDFGLSRQCSGRESQRLEAAWMENGRQHRDRWRGRRDAPVCDLGARGRGPAQQEGPGLGAHLEGPAHLAGHHRRL